MPDSIRQKHFVHRGRISQVPIYLGKQFRGFLYQSDWKVLPMSAIIAALMTMVVRNTFGINEEGTLLGAFGIACVAVWNGTFNSIQVICRERDIIKREHRSGMHISSYIVSHMLYQALLCLAQTVITLFVAVRLNMRFPEHGVIFSYTHAELALTMFLVSYASDMLSLFVSALVRNTTAAMTVMPFILIFQLVFAGGFFQLPENFKKVSKFTVSHYGLRSVAATMDYNGLPSAMAWNAVSKMSAQNISGRITLGQVLDLLGENGSTLFTPIRESAITVTAKESEEKLLAALPEETRLLAKLAYEEAVPMDASYSVTVGEVIDSVAALPGILERRDEGYDFSFTVKELMGVLGEENVKKLFETAGSAAAYSVLYENTEENIEDCWTHLILIALAFAALSMLMLEFIDKDKR